MQEYSFQKFHLGKNCE